jgi:hypothetical protein
MGSGDPAVAGTRQIPKAESNSDGAVAWTTGAIPNRETGTGRVSIATAIYGRLLVGLVGTARGREAGGVTLREIAVQFGVIR